MAISTDYPTPVMVNGFSCKNCTDVDYAKKHIDPAHPKSGPYGIDAKDDPTVHKNEAVTFGGTLQAPAAAAKAQDAAGDPAPNQQAFNQQAGNQQVPGQQVDVTA